MANTIESVKINNPYNVEDTCSHIVVNDNSYILNITDCMPYITTYSYQFWIKSNATKVVSFSCDNTFKNINTETSWRYFHVTFNPTQISDIQLVFQAGEYWIYNMKLETGSYNTDWSPHPEDNTGAYDKELEEIRGNLSSTTEAISTVTSLADRVNEVIENSVSKTTFEASLGGIINDMNDMNAPITDGKDCWHLSIYDKDAFINTGKEAIDDKEKYDITIFSLENSSLLPIEERIIPDEKEDMEALQSLHTVYYYLTFAKFTTAKKMTTSCAHQKCTLYLNGIPILSSDTEQRDTIIMNFQKGINTIEIVTNEGYFVFDQNIHELDECEFMNCLLATPTTRNLKIMNQSASLKVFADKILSTVSETITESFQGVDGEIETKLVSYESALKQTARLINSVVKGLNGVFTSFSQDSDSFVMSIYDNTDQDNPVTSLSLTPEMLQAVTNQFIIKDEDGNAVIIERGNIKANAITTTMLNTNAIKSINYQGYSDATPPTVVPAFSTKGTFLDLASGNFYSPGFFMDGRTGNAYFKGTISSTSGNIGSWKIGDKAIYRVNGTYKNANGIYLGESGISFGDKLSYDTTNGLVINGNVTATTGNIGGWAIGSDYIKRGTGGYNTAGTIYLGASGISFGQKLTYDGSKLSINGTVNSTDGNIGGWTIDANSINTGGTYNTSGKVYLGKDGKVSLGNKLTFDGANLSVNGTITSNSGKIGPWNITDTSIWKGNSALGTSGNANIYLGDAGFSLSNKFVYNTNNGSLNLTVDSISIGSENIKDSLDKSQTHFGNGVPTLDWGNSNSKHIGNVYYDQSTGDSYKFSQRTNSSYIPGIIIKFSSNSRTENNNDFVQIYYSYNSKYYQTTKLSGTSIANAEVFVPNTSFYLHWKTDSSTNNYYGFEIESVKQGYGPVPASGNSVTALPTVPVSITVATGELPSSAHNNNYYNNINVLYIINSGLSLLTATNQYYWELLQHNDPNASNTAKNYLFWSTGNGLVINSSKKIVSDSEITNDIGGNVRIKSDGLHIYQGTKELTKYGEQTEFYSYTNNVKSTATVLNSSGMTIQHGAITLGQANSTNYLHFGEDGMQLYDRLKYDVVTNNLTLKVDSLDIGSVGLRDYIIGNIDGTTIYQGSDTPTNSNYPAKTWQDTNKTAEHVGAMFQNTSDGKVYQYTFSSSYRYQITFASGQNIKANDYVSIYYVSNNIMQKVTQNITGTTNSTIIIPVDNFYVYFHTSGGGNNSYYGFTISGVSEVSGTTSLSSTTITNLPNYNVENLIPGTYPQSLHNYDKPGSAALNKIWYVQSGKGKSRYSWVETKNSVFARFAQTYMHYDATNGLVLHQGGLSFSSSNAISYNTANASNIRLTSDGMKIYKGDKLLAFYGDTIQLYAKGDTTPATEVTSDGLIINRGSINLGNGVFQVDKNGAITATSGTIGGFIIDSDSIRTGEKSDTSNNSIVLSKSKFYRKIGTNYGYDFNFAIGNNFAVMTDGKLYCSGGAIGGIFIGSNYIGTYAMVASNGLSSTSNGFYMNSSGQFRVNSESSYIISNSDGISMNVKSLTIGGSAPGAAYHGTGVPTNSNAPASSWTTDADKKAHDGAIYIDDNTGLSYTYSSVPVYTYLRINITYQTESSTADYDYVDIYYTPDINSSNLYRVRLKNNVKTTEDIDLLVSNSGTYTYRLHWRTDSSNSSYYGYKINSVSITAKKNRQIIGTSVSSYPSNTYTSTSTFLVESAHSPYSNNTNNYYQYSRYIETQKYAGWGQSPNNYILYDNTGLYIHSTAGAKKHGDITGGNLWLTSSALAFRSNEKVLMELTGSFLQFYDSYGNSAASLSTGGFSIERGSVKCGSNFNVNIDGIMTAKAGTIGGINITSNSIYGGLTYSNGTYSGKGFYLTSSGDFYVSDGTYYIKMISGVLSLSAGLGGSSSSDTSSYIQTTSNGIKIGRYPNNRYYPYIELTTEGLNIYSLYNNDVTFLSAEFKDYISLHTYFKETMRIQSDDIYFVSTNNNAGIKVGQDSTSFAYANVLISYDGIFLDYADTSHGNNLSEQLTSVTIEKKGLVTAGEVKVKQERYHNSTGDFNSSTYVQTTALSIDSHNTTNTFKVNYNGYAYTNGSTVTSDLRFKDIQNIPLTSYKDIFMNLKPIVFKWNAEMRDDKLHFGVGAQNVLEIIDKSTQDNLALIDTSNPDHYYANYIELLMLSVPVVQSHERQIQELQQQVADLQEEVTELRKKVK